MPDELWNVEDRRHNHEGWRHPLIVGLIDSFLVPLLRTDAIVHDILPNRSAQMLANDEAAFDPASGLDLPCVLLEAGIDMTFDGRTEEKQNEFSG